MAGESEDSPFHSVSSLGVAHYAAERRCFHVSLSCIAAATLPQLRSRNDPVVAMVDELVNVCTRLNSRVRREVDSRQRKEIFLCGICNATMVDAVTVACGSSFCQNCILANQYRPCLMCKAQCYNRRYHPNIIVNKCIELSHPVARQKRMKKDEGNNFMSVNDFIRAIESYTSAIALDDGDHFLLGNRAKAFLSIGKYEAALDDSDSATKINPFWTKGFYRKAITLKHMGCFPEAALNFFICLCISPAVKEAKDGLLFSLRQIMKPIRLTEFLVRLQDCAVDYLNMFQVDRLALLREMSNVDISHWFQRLLNVPETDEAVLKPGNKRRASETPISASPRRKCMRLTDDYCVDYKACTGRCHTVPDYPAILNIDDFECCLCFRLVHEPVTTPCGHSFCRQCLARCLDYNPECPLCKQSLVRYLEERRDGVTEVMQRIMSRCWPEDVENRKRIYEEEISRLSRAGLDLQHDLPIFVCTLAFPFVPCPLHVFEPRYRLMIRRCMEVPAPKFGMTVGVDGPQRFVSVGTILNIRDVQYLPDGRSFVDTVGGRRFRVVQRSMTDGYHTARIELISDEELSAEKKDALTPTCQNFHSRLCAWYHTLGSQAVANFGPLPPLDLQSLGSHDGPSWLWWLVAILPQDYSTQLELIASTSFESRLTAMMNLFSNLFSM